MVQPDREGRVGQRLGWRAADFTGGDVKRQRSRQVRRDREGAARKRVVGRQRGDGGVVHAHQRGRWNRAERVGVRPSDAHAGHARRSVAHAVIVGVRVAWVGAGVVLVNVGTGAGFRRVVVAVAVIVQVLFEARRADRVVDCVVIAWQSVGRTVAVQVLQDFEEEGPRDAHAAAVVGPHRVGRVGHHHVRRAPDGAVVRVELHRGRQRRNDGVGRTGEGHEGCNLRNRRVVDQGDRRGDGGHAVARVRTGNAHASDRIRPVAHAVTVGVGVERVRARVRAVDIVASTRLNAVVQTVAVVVAVGHKTRGRSFRRVVIARQVVGQAVAVVVRKAPQVEREGLGGAAVVRGRHRVGGVG